PPPPSSTLFPYTTLFRSEHLEEEVDLDVRALSDAARRAEKPDPDGEEPRGLVGPADRVLQDESVHDLEQGHQHDRQHHRSAESVRHYVDAPSQWQHRDLPCTRESMRTRQPARARRFRKTGRCSALPLALDQVEQFLPQ